MREFIFFIVSEIPPNFLYDKSLRRGLARFFQKNEFRIVQGIVFDLKSCYNK